MTPRQVSCNTQISKITTSYDHPKRYIPRILQHPTPKTQDPESEPSVPRGLRQPAHRTTSASFHFIPAARSGPEDHLQAQQYQPKIWNIQIDFFNHAYSYLSKTNQINYDTYQETEPNYNNSIITIQRLHLRKSSLQEYPSITQSSNTFQHLNSESVPSVEHSLRSGLHDSHAIQRT